MTVSRFLRAALLSVGLALAALTSFAASEPTITQIYDAAKAGKVEQAQQMIEQVLRDHPKSAKAHYVQAELFGVQGRLTEGQQELAKAEALDPGLPFAKPQAVAALRERLKQGGPNASVKPKAGSLAADAGIGGVGAAKGAGTTVQPAAEAPVAKADGSAARKGFQMPWGTIVMIGAGLAALFLIFRRKPAQTFQAPAGGYPMGAQPAGGPYAGGPAPSGGSNIMGGLATGLAVGAGVLAAQQIGQRVFGRDDEHRGGHDTPSSGSGGGSGYVPMDANSDMGGTDFGISDAGSWDSGGSSDGGGGGDWD